MKKFLIILLSLVLSVSMFAFAACSDTPADDDPQTGNEQTGDDGQDGTQPDGDDENAGAALILMQDGNSILVATSPDDIAEEDIESSPAL